MPDTSDAPSPWERPPRRGRGPRPGLTREDLAAAAIRVADAEGLAAVTMRALAEATGTVAGALYRYVGSRDELLALMADAALADALTVPRSGVWLADMVALARSALDLYRRHPWLPELSGRSAVFGPRTLEHFETGLAILAAVPASTAAKFEALAMVTGLASLFARGADAGSADPRRLFSLATAEAHPFLLRELARPVERPEPADLFERTVRAVLPGLLDDGVVGMPHADSEPE
ncbi:TetR/AcrR family transcriptional regulator [Naasia aerilata]|uniref:TetR family transcriptional regulator n=1 Tax=Naasia aerilata TaxID=1162966 RepID=A0ABN6XKQ3_9MICO|nr:TetR family transcriptional regulator [Naasia aerilata]BDZ45479.1 TetR family transcriptional regulator [Naasia aerilata]